MKITKVKAIDVRFPTSLDLDGSDAMNPDPDYSAAYVILETDTPDLEGHGLTFTIGRGNEVCVEALKSLAPLVEGSNLTEIFSDMGAFWKKITGDSQLRWIGPEKGAIHLATAAIVNAVWDLFGQVEKKPLWKLIADMTPEEFVKCVDFTYLTDAITKEEALAMLKEKEATKGDRIKILQEKGYPAYTTSAGWLGYSDEKIKTLCRESLAGGWTHFKVKVGADVDDDIRRLRIIREEIGYDRKLMTDANQRWDVGQAIENMKKLAEFKPWWIEEPTSPDDVLGHARIRRELKPFGIGVATGEMCQNRVIWKQFFQAEAVDFCQIDSCRLGGVNEILSVLLMAAKFGVPVCPHGGGVALCNYIQHLSMIDFICVSGSMENRLIEYVDHLHDHLYHPPIMNSGHYMPPSAPGYSIRIKEQSIDEYTFPNGKVWKELAAKRKQQQS